MNSATLVQKHWNYCNALRDDGMSYGDYVEQPPTCCKGTLGLIFGKAQNKFQDPDKLWRVIVDLIDKGNSSALSADVKGDAHEGLL